MTGFVFEGVGARLVSLSPDILQADLALSSCCLAVAYNSASGVVLSK